MCCSQKPTIEVKTSLKFIHFFQQVKRFSKYERKPLICERLYLTDICMYRQLFAWYYNNSVIWILLHYVNHSSLSGTTCSIVHCIKNFSGNVVHCRPAFSINRTVSLTSLSSTNWTHFTLFPIRKGVPEFTMLSFEWKHCSIWLVTDILGEHVVIFPIKSATFLTWLTSALKMKASCSS